MRKLKQFNTLRLAPNSLLLWHKAKNPFRVAFNFLIIYFCKYVPSLSLKPFLLRLTGMKVEKNAAIGLAVTFDIFWPELITIKENCIIGYNCTILCHEFLLKEYRTGEVIIEKNAVIGANTTILPGVRIGENSVVSTCSLVNKDVSANAFVGGIPIKPIKQIKKIN